MRDANIFFGTFNTKIINDDVLTTNKIANYSIDLIVTSPPYNVDIQYNSHNDKLTYEKYLEFTKKWLSKCYNWLKDDGRFCLNIPLDKNKDGHQSVGADTCQTKERRRTEKFLCRNSESI